MHQYSNAYIGSVYSIYIGILYAVGSGGRVSPLSLSLLMYTLVVYTVYIGILYAVESEGRVSPLSLSLYEYIHW